MAQRLRQPGWSFLKRTSPYPAGVPEERPLRLALQALHWWAVAPLTDQGFELSDLKSVRRHVALVPWSRRHDDPWVHTRAVITAMNDRTYDSGWLG